MCLLRDPNNLPNQIKLIWYLVFELLSSNCRESQIEFKADSQMLCIMLGIKLGHMLGIKLGNMLDIKLGILLGKM